MRAFSKREAREFYRRLAETRPIPQTELEFINPFTLLVAVVLSAQATDAGVNKATPALFALADKPQKLLALGEERIVELIRTIGLFRTKAKNLIALSRILVEQNGGTVPRDRAALEALPGVGRKTANVVLNVAFGEPTIAVDNRARGDHACRIQALCASLADPARALRVPGPQARLPPLHPRRSLPLRRQDRPCRADCGPRRQWRAEGADRARGRACGGQGRPSASEAAGSEVSGRLAAGTLVTSGMRSPLSDARSRQRCRRR